MMKPVQIVITLLLVGILIEPGLGQPIEGKWKTVDDETNEVKSIVEIAERDGKMYGKIIKLFRSPDEDPDPLCTKCPVDDVRYNKKVLGMEIIKDLVTDQNAYSGGTILDPEVGKVYRCRLWIEQDKLKVRGYWGLFYRTQSWDRYR